MRHFSKCILLSIAFLANSLLIFSQQNYDKGPEAVIKAIFNEALTDNTAANHLEYLCKQAPNRIVGSANSYKAVEYTRKALTEAGADSVWLQPVMVPHWVRGREECHVISDKLGKVELTIAILGLSTATSAKGISTEVVEVQNFDELKTLGREKIQGRIVFFNRPVDNTLINTFTGYGEAVNQRTFGASEAAAYGAAGVIVRSVTQFIDDFPHTGTLRYNENENKIPAVAVSTIDAELLSGMLKTDPLLRVNLVSMCKTLPDTLSYNVVAEIRGHLKPGEYITAGGHLDSWDITEGAHDDAGGCVQAIEMIRICKKLGIKPKRTIRAVMFMNEEISGTGGKAYAAGAVENGEIHYAALESDRGVMSPRGFAFDAAGERLSMLQSLSGYFLPYNIRDFDTGGGGSDIAPLKALGALQIGYIPDIQRYFSYHHSANDTFEQVNIREMQMGSAAIASLVYLIDLLDY
jgi:hypothetical protein